MEIELRAKINEPASLEKSLGKLPGIKEKKAGERQIDVYLRHEKDNEKKSIIRIRKSYDNEKAILTFKGSSSGRSDDIAWEDYDTPIENPDKLERLLVGNGYVYVCLIDKMRQSFIYNEFEINIDNIRYLGIFIEIEKIDSEKEIDEVKKEITSILELCGIAEQDIIKKGYVQLMLEKLNT